MTPLRSLNDISTVIRLSRRQNGWTQAQLAARSGVAEKHISRIENGANEPGISTVLDLFAALGLTLQAVPPATPEDQSGASVADLF